MEKSAVEKMQANKDVEGLIRALKYEKESIQCHVAGALGNIGDKRAIEPLIESLKDENEHVRSSAAEAIGNIRK